jgi:hypothetical protein
MRANIGFAALRYQVRSVPAYRSVTFIQSHNLLVLCFFARRGAGSPGKLPPRLADQCAGLLGK